MIERSGSVFDRRPEPFVLLPLGSIENKSPPPPTPSSLSFRCSHATILRSNGKFQVKGLREEIIVPVMNECENFGARAPLTSCCARNKLHDGCDIGTERPFTIDSLSQVEFIKLYVSLSQHKITFMRDNLSVERYPTESQNLESKHALTYRSFS